ncbi:T9SS type A sorting domain-containing protein [Hymenobacter sp. UYCo722]|uniref:T9SS type A sorting domain-containing protein n=1 Tax=Hymenobacter sp. UYCo722 TaxID=3156335 RepID=UPI003399F5A9
MKTWAILLFLMIPPLAHAQVVQPAGSVNVPVNWHPMAAADSVLVDVDGDAVPDVRFKNTNTSPTGQGMPSFTNFVAGTTARSSAEIAIDDNEFDSAHRFAAGDAIGPGLRWQRGSTYLAYIVTGNGGTGGRGFFRNNADGFVTIGKAVGNQMRYWWFYIGPRAAPGSEWVVYYSGSSVALAAGTPGPPAAAIQAFPNPTTSHLALSGAAAYQLFDCQGRLQSSSFSVPVSAIDVNALPCGLYLLETRGADGRLTRQKVVKR